MLTHPRPLSFPSLRWTRLKVKPRIFRDRWVCGYKSPSLKELLAAWRATRSFLLSSVI